MEAPPELSKSLFFPLYPQHLLLQHLRKKDVQSKFVAGLLQSLAEPIV